VGRNGRMQQDSKTLQETHSRTIQNGMARKIDCSDKSNQKILNKDFHECLGKQRSRKWNELGYIAKHTFDRFEDGPLICS